MLKKFRRFIGRFLYPLLWMLAGVFIIFGSLSLYMIFGLPDVNVLKDVHLQEPLRVYSVDGKLMAQFGAKWRTPVEIDQVPKQFIEAILATEDARFYSHSIDIIGIMRAALAVMTTGHKVQGASTITMQVARNFFLSPEKTYSRKIKEMLLAIKIDQAFSKEKILELYLNKVYFGNRAYGVVAAAQVYYGKKLDQLTLPEIAMLAGLPQAPSRSNPLRNEKSAIERRDHVLKRMWEVGYISQGTYKKATQASNTARYHGQNIQLNAPYVAEMVRQSLVMMYGPRVYDAGLRVTTTLRSDLQTAAVTALQTGLVNFAKQRGMLATPPKIQGAIIALDPKTGAILALQGGYDFNQSAFNRVTQAQRQPGSAFKPFLYSAALAKGLTLATIINDAPIIMRDTGENAWWRPENDTKKFYGPTRLRVALARSRNLVSIRLLSTIGIPYALDYLQRFGFDPDKLPHQLSLALGSGVVTPMQMANAFSVFANGGYHIKPYFIQKIAYDHDEVLYEATPQKLETPVITPQNAYLMTQAMQEVMRSGTGSAASVLKRNDLAGKTGTTNNQIDAWFAGFNSNMLAVVWTGYDDSARSLHAHGAQIALPIWIQFMKTALANQPSASMPQPPGVVTVKINSTTGFIANANDPSAIFEVFDEQVMPQAGDSSGSQMDNGSDEKDGGIF